MSTVSNNNTSFFQPATLPAPLIELHKAMADAGRHEQRRQAAFDLLQEYFSFFDAADLRQEMWQLLCAALGNKKPAALKKAGNRQNLLFFYEFTLLVLDAAHVLRQACGPQQSSSTKQA